MSLLSLEHINSGYGKKQVLFDVSLKFRKGQTTLLIGSNGSGKSTLFKTIFGVLPLWQSHKKTKIIFKGQNITNVKSHDLIKKGIMYIPQKNELFEDMTVKQNLEMSILYLNDKLETRKRLDEVFEQLQILRESKGKVASSLSGGERKLLSLGMVLMNRPELLLYDEPLAGLSGKNVNMLLSWLERIKDKGTTTVIIEHRIKETLNIADSVIGLKLGRINTESINDLQSIKSYLL